MTPKTDHHHPPGLGSRVHYGWIIAITGMAVLFSCLGLGRFALGMLLPSMGSSLNLNYSQMGLIGTANFIGYMVSVVLAGLIARAIGAVPGERYRLLWDNIAIWYRLYRFFRPFMDAGACFVADTYTNAWTMALDADDPFVGMAQAYTGVFINIDLQARMHTISDLAQRFQVDGMVMHANHSCKPFSITQSQVRDRLRDEFALPTLILEADMCDARLYNEGAVQERIEAFLEML